MLTCSGWSITHIGENSEGPYDVVAFATKWQLRVRGIDV